MYDYKSYTIKTRDNVCGGNPSVSVSLDDRLAYTRLQKYVSYSVYTRKDKNHAPIFFKCLLFFPR